MVRLEKWFQVGTADTPTGGVEKSTTWASVSPSDIFDPTGSIDDGAYPKVAALDAIYGLSVCKSCWAEAVISTLQVGPLMMFMYPSRQIAALHATTDGISNLQMIPRIKFKRLGNAGAGVNIRSGKIFLKVNFLSLFQKDRFDGKDNTQTLGASGTNTVFMFAGIVRMDGLALTDSVIVNCLYRCGGTFKLSSRDELVNPP